jgi:hypothetical protein
MDIDIEELVRQSVRTSETGCALCDADGDLAAYVARLDETEKTEANRVIRTAVHQTLRNAFNVRIGRESISRHFNEHCGH